jgi:4'-phosphopantetheinyl transferase
VAASAAAWQRERAEHRAERERSDGIAQPQRRAQFQAGRWLAAQMLATHVGGRPEDWSTCCASAEPPRVSAGPATTWPHLSLSHRGPWVCCALAAVPVGIDLELDGRLTGSPADLQSFVLAPAERTAFLAQPPSARAGDLLARWTLKEAWFKRAGTGMALGDMAGVQAREQAAGGNARLWRHGGLVLALCADGIDDRLAVQGLADVPMGSAWMVEAVPMAAQADAA